MMWDDDERNTECLCPLPLQHMTHDKEQEELGEIIKVIAQSNNTERMGVLTTDHEPIFDWGDFDKEEYYCTSCSLSPTTTNSSKDLPDILVEDDTGSDTSSERGEEIIDKDKFMYT